MHIVLLIDDDPVVRSLASGIMRKKGYEVIVAKDGLEGLSMVKKHRPDLVITDYQMPGMSGIEVLESLKLQEPEMPVIILTAHGDASLTIKSMQSGAFDFIEKPINPKELLETIRSGIHTVESLRKKSSPVPGSPGSKPDKNLMVGKSAAMRELFKSIGRISKNNVNVLITGESGTGKERLARLIHQSGDFSDQPLIYINCKAIDEDQLTKGINSDEVRLSYHEGPIASKLQQAGHGTVILDEVGMLSPAMQGRLLDLMNFLGFEIGEGGKLQPRFISVSTRDIGKMVDQGLFIKELYFKLKVFSMHIPPLRERKSDIPELVNHIIQDLNPTLDKHITTLEDGVISLLQSYEWPGNVRELKNVLMQAMVFSHGELLKRQHVYIEGLPEADAKVKHVTSKNLVSLAEIEKEHISHVLEFVGWNKQEASSVLGITRPTLNAKIDKYGLSR